MAKYYTTTDPIVVPIFFDGSRAAHGKFLPAGSARAPGAQENPMPPPAAQ